MKTLDELIFEAPYTPTEWERNALHYLIQMKRGQLLEKIAQLEKETIIRCNECKYAHMTANGECKYCDIWSPDEKVYLSGDYFCASAERKE